MFRNENELNLFKQLYPRWDGMSRRGKLRILSESLRKRNVVNSTDYMGSAQDTSRGPSMSLWGNCPVLDFIEDPGKGSYFFDDFVMAGNLANTNAIGNMGQWATWADTSTVLGTDPMQDDGVILLSDAANITKNVTLGTQAGSARMVSAATNNPLHPGRIWFEARVAVGSITTACKDAFVGLCDNTNFTTATATKVINTANILATTNGLFGFHFRSTTNPTDVGLAYNVAGGTVQYPTNLQTLSNTVLGAALTAYTAGATGALATGFIKLGFLYDPTAGNPAQAAPATVTIGGVALTAGTLYKPIVKIFVNGLVAATFLAPSTLQTTTFPTGWMGPVISYTSRSATVAGGFYVDWIRVARSAIG